jgi:hypothetical protein
MTRVAEGFSHGLKLVAATQNAGTATTNFEVGLVSSTHGEPGRAPGAPRA